MAKTKSKNKITETDSVTFAEEIAETIDDLYVGEITSGEFFKKSFDEHVVRFSPDMILKLMDRIDSYSYGELIDGFGLEQDMIVKWYKDYEKTRTKFKLLNLQLTLKSTTSAQTILFYYLIKLGIINEDALNAAVPNYKDKSKLVAFLFSKTEDNVRLALRQANLRDKEGKYYTKNNMELLLKMAQEIKYKSLEELIIKDIARKHK